MGGTIHDRTGFGVNDTIPPNPTSNRGSTAFSIKGESVTSVSSRILIGDSGDSPLTYANVMTDPTQANTQTGCWRHNHKGNFVFFDLHVEPASNLQASNSLAYGTW